MSFIPIDAKADLQGEKKGKITPAQHAILNAWGLASKTGILDFPKNHSVAGRCEATALNITNIQNYETEITFNKGYLVICGRLVECEDNTKFVFKTPTTGTEIGKIVARFSLGSSGNEEFKIIQKTGALTQQDLNENAINGIYEFELYSYEATPTAVTLERTQPYIPDIGDRLEQFEQSLTAEGKPLGGYRISEGTIEERLTDLGFKEGSVTGVSGATLTKQGKYAILTIPERAFYYTANEQKTKTLTMSFTSASKIVSYIIFQETTSSQYIGTPYEITIEGNTIKFTTPKIYAGPTIFNRYFNVGFEISDWQ